MFISLNAFMFMAGYQWRKLESRDRHEAPLDSMIRKI
jgi:hypothetical protein